MVHRDNEVLQANRARMVQRESQELAVNGAKLVPQEFQDLRVKMAKMDHLENLVQMEFQETQEKGVPLATEDLQGQMGQEDQGDHFLLDFQEVLVSHHCLVHLDFRAYPLSLDLQGFHLGQVLQLLL